jgi:hypothetical protein
MVFLARSLLGPLDRQPMIAGKGFYPGLVVGGTLPEDLLADCCNANDVTEEVHHLLGPRQTAEVTVNDNAVEAVVDESQQVTEELGEQFHGSPPRDPPGVAKPSDVDPASRSSEAGIFVWPMKYAISSAGRPITTAASSPSVN